VAQTKAGSSCCFAVARREVGGTVGVQIGPLLGQAAVGEVSAGIDQFADSEPVASFL
jgi:hypothetical protein